MTKLILDNPLDLQDFNPIEKELVTGNKDYSSWLKRTKSIFLKLMQSNPTIELRPYQYEYAAMYCTRRHNICAGDMSLGKTLISCLTIAALYKVEKLKPNQIHIAVPNLLAAHRWLSDLNKIEELRTYFSLVRTETELLNNKTPIVIYSYDFPKYKSRLRRSTSRPFISRVIRKRFKPSFLIIDEVHGLTKSTSRTKHINYIREKAKRVLVLSGTLSDGNLDKIFHTCKLVYGNDWQYINQKTFKQYFGIKKTITSNYISGNTTDHKPRYLSQLDPTKLAEYYNLSRLYIHRIRLDDPEVKKFITIPATNSFVHLVEPSYQQDITYKNYLNFQKSSLEIVSQFNEIAYQAKALKMLLPLISICNSPEPPGEKLFLVERLIREAKGKVIIFANYVDSARRVESYLKQIFKDQVVRLYATDNKLENSSMSEEERVEVVDKFQNDDSIRIGIFSINLASEAVDLTAASDVIYYCLPWSATKIMQSMARAVRPGNPYSEVNLHYIAHRGLIDEHQLNLATAKIKGAKLILDYEVEKEKNQDLSPTEAIKELLKIK